MSCILGTTFITFLMEISVLRIYTSELLTFIKFLNVKKPVRNLRTLLFISNTSQVVQTSSEKLNIRL